MDRVVIALGGNALLGPRGQGTVDEAISAIEETASGVIAAIEAGYEVVLTHGNGPQVGTLLLQQERAPETPQLPLDVIVAETQASIGYLLQQALDNELMGTRDFVTLVTQAVVDPDDPAFEQPTKPVGPFYAEEEAHDRPFETRKVRDGPRPYRRVVPSPHPQEIVELAEIKGLVDQGNLVICAGGGGVPVMRQEGLLGVEAVVDKDRTAALLADELEAAWLVLLTDVDHAYTGYGTDREAPIEETETSTLRNHLEADEFGVGSMRPKVESCLEFVTSADRAAVITTPDSLLAALDGSAGTIIYPDT